MKPSSFSQLGSFHLPRVLIVSVALMACGGRSDSDRLTEPGTASSTVASVTVRSEPDEERPPGAGCEVPYPDWVTSPYVLPYPVGEEHLVALDNCSSSFHAAGQPDSFAYDFDLGIGDTVTAARAGVVLHVDESQADYGGGLGNIVVIDHGDDTRGIYLHFTTDGVDVENGQEVVAGDVLGQSGASGLAGYPHLHFIVVDAPGDYPYSGVAVTFSNTSPNPFGPQTGDVLRAEAPR